MNHSNVFDLAQPLAQPLPVGAQTSNDPPPPDGTTAGRAGGEADEWRALAGVTVPVAVAIPIDLVDPNPHQPRQDFDQARQDELANSIREHGLIQPIIVEPSPPSGGPGGPGRFTLHAGERRLRACKQLGLAEIPAYIVPPGASPRALLIRAVVENVQRADMNPLELAKAFQEMADEHGLSDAEIARQVQKSRSVVANTRRLLNLPEERQRQVASGDLNERQALALLPLYQLPEDIQAKALDTWDGKKLAKPTNLSSDQIRGSLNAATRAQGQTLELITPDQAIAADGKYIRSARCLDCDHYVKLGGDMFCLDRACLRVKQNLVIAAYLEQAGAATGLAYLDPALELEYSQIDGFDGTTGAQALSAALETKCANLRLEFRRRSWDYGAGPNAFDKCRYRCFHDGQGCACAGALRAAAQTADKVKREAVQQLTNQAINHLIRIIADNHPNLLRAILNTMLNNFYGGGDDKTHKLKPDQVIHKLAEQLVQRNVYPSEYRPLDENRATLDKWLAMVGLPAMDQEEQDPLTDLDRRLARIESWIADLPPSGGPGGLDAINGNLTNLAKIAEEMAQAEAPAALLARYDAAKRALLARREEADAVEPSPPSGGSGGAERRQRKPKKQPPSPSVEVRVEPQPQEPAP